jgi:dTDP-4-dehydrorhamnose 3,5-epimerase
MQIQEVFIKGLKIIEPKIFEDERGLFYESYNALQYEKVGIIDKFLQDNQSLSKKGVLRGLHFQTGNYAQAKLVRVIKGAVIDVAVDLRRNSSTFGKHFALELNAKNNYIFYIPIGFAHGFVSIEDDTIFSYKCSAVYNKESEGGIVWNDHQLNIDWSYLNPILSEKDKILPAFNPEIAFF